LFQNKLDEKLGENWNMHLPNIFEKSL